MSTREIVDRFRRKSHALAGVYHKTGNIAYAALAGACHEAAEELDRLSAENQRLREALTEAAAAMRAELAEAKRDAEKWRAFRKLAADNFACGIEVNDHKLSYEQCEPGEEVRLYAYPDTPVGFNSWRGQDIDAAIDAALKDTP